MTTKQYTVCRIFIVMILAGLVSMSVTQGFIVLPIISIITATGALYYCRKRTRAVLADERDYQIAGKAARYAVFVFAWPAALGSMVFMALREQNFVYEVIGHVLAYSVCFLLLTQAFMFKYLSSKKS